jgi:hypothetical protein
MLYPIDEEVINGLKTAVHSCRKCEYNEIVQRDNPIVYEHVLREDKSVRLVMNPYLKHDPTLDHLTNIICPNADCSSRNGSTTSDIVPVELNEKYSIWMYQCVNCNTTWKQNAGMK